GEHSTFAVLDHDGSSAANLGAGARGLQQRAAVLGGDDEMVKEVRFCRHRERSLAASRGMDHPPTRVFRRAAAISRAGPASRLSRAEGRADFARVPLYSSSARPKMAKAARRMVFSS